MTYPIAELFKSTQGEGRWAGAYMAFVRLAGCTVGKPYTQQERENYFVPGSAHNFLNVYQEKCTLWDGKTEMACDTNYRMSQKFTVEDIVKEVGDIQRVCITGGEPLMHDLLPLIKGLNGRHIHIETSGTKDLEELYKYPGSVLWITVSPKHNFLRSSLVYASEIKVLVNSDTFNEAEFEQQFKNVFYKTWIQPVNDENEIRQDNLQRCIELQKKFPLVSISLQSHKIMKVR